MPLNLVGALLLILGLQVRAAAVVLFLYLIPVTFIMHNFWAMSAAEQQFAIESFGKGLMIMGGLFYVYTFGSGPLSLDQKSNKSSK